MVKKITVLVLYMVFANFNAYSQNTSVAEQFTNWLDNTGWSTGTNPSANPVNDELIINGSVTRWGNLSISRTLFGSMSLTVNTGDSLVIDGDFTIGTESELIVQEGGYLYVNGNLNNNGFFFFGGDVSNDGIIGVTGDYNETGSATFDRGPNSNFYVNGNSDEPTDGSVPPEIEMVYTTLPIELKSFSVSKRGQTIELGWITAKEENFSHFEIQRASSDMEFELIGIMEGNGNSLSDILYNYRDFDAPFGDLHYRLNAVDIDGSSEYSEIVSIKKAFDGAAKIYPNPANHQESVKLQLPANFNQQIESLSIYDPTGQLLKTYKDFDPVSDELNFQSLQDGIFVIKLNYNGLVENIRIVVR
ncbi:hypothetical protein GCM10027429_09010 [Marivirga atlantica]|jgi:hypothetical protein|uniref:T9SS type A sorting domain-containing protein n=1 Tax=Marivirga atlantica TaxID=1548457 RepID=A0A937DIT4_9BACT|nr:T9SS type A sorting domain-containing protein [Marivirga atlantica]MBL0764511.1 T9SS type A sorting domain-containing protein [Marivirga atlantica]